MPFESIEIESESTEPNLLQVKKLSQEGRQRNRKRQKLIKIADKSRDSRQVVAEYESDELASGSDDEKRLKKAREAASSKRRQKEQEKEPPLYFVYSYVFWIRLRILPYFLCDLFVLWELKGKMIYVRLREAN